MVKKIKQDQQEQEDIEESWSLKRIILGILIIVFLFGGVIYLAYTKVKDKGFVLGSSTPNFSKAKDDTREQSKKEIEKVLTQVKEDISKIDPENITSSSPEIQKVIDDLKSLQAQKDALDNLCNQVCKK